MKHQSVQLIVSFLFCTLAFVAAERGNIAFIIIGMCLAVLMYLASFDQRGLHN